MSDIKEVGVDAILRFYDVTGYNLMYYINLYNDFVVSDYNSLKSFLQGNTTILDTNGLKKLKELQEQGNEVEDMFIKHKTSFNNAKYWVLYDYIENIRSEVTYYQKLSKWLRSSVNLATYSQNPQYEYVLPQSTTLQTVSEKILNSNDPENDWVDIAINNQLYESQYTDAGGNVILIKQQNQPIRNLNVTSIVDNLYGERLYGLDLDRNLHFDPQTNDLAVLSYKNTVLQSVDILIRLIKGDIPQLPTLGKDLGLLIGSNIGSFSISSLLTQANRDFLTDDSLQNFKITKISYKNGDISIQYNIDTLYHVTLQSQSIVQTNP